MTVVHTSVMNTKTIINIKADRATKAQAARVAERLGEDTVEFSAIDTHSELYE